jgi:hypothetical protein
MLELRLSNDSLKLARLRSSRSVRWLFQMCVESAQQMLKIVTALQEQSLLGEPCHPPPTPLVFDILTTIP